MNILSTSDKVFWHGYIDFYERFFQGREFRSIAEIGIFKGNSIRWLLERFPGAHIYGADILPIQPEWPVDPRFTFMQLDQGNVQQLRRFFGQSEFDLVIEDGSHIPEHQVLGLLEGLKSVKSGGLYILEDIHTSHPAYGKKKRGLFGSERIKGNALSALLAIDHYKRISVPIDADKASLIARDSLLQPADVRFLAENITTIALYKRTRLPDSCYKCGATDYDFSTYRCRCGEAVFSDSDSMSFVLEKV